MLVAGLVASSGQAAWIELGDQFIQWDGARVDVFSISPALPGTPEGPARAARSPLEASYDIAPGEALLLVRFRHEDPSSLLAAAGRVVARSEGRVLLLAGPPGIGRLARLDGDHLRVDPAPEDVTLVRRQRGVPGVVAPALPADADRVDIARWQADLQHLVDFGTRHSRKPGLAQAAEWARGQLAAAGWQAQVEPFSMGGAQVPNVVARLHAGDDRPIVVVGAHLDSINYRNSNDAPGADDNASGSAGVLELARVLAAARPEDPGVELRVLLFGGEEQGLRGSRALVRRWQSSGELSRVKAMVNLDMIGFDEGGPLEVLLETEPHGQAELDRMAALAEATDLVVSTTTDAWGSDHVPFLDAGVPAILPIEGEYDDNPHDHTGHDDVEHVNPALAHQILRLVTAYVLDAVERARP